MRVDMYILIHTYFVSHMYVHTWYQFYFWEEGSEESKHARESKTKQWRILQRSSTIHRHCKKLNLSLPPSNSSSSSFTYSPVWRFSPCISLHSSPRVSVFSFFFFLSFVLSLWRSFFFLFFQQQQNAAFSTSTEPLIKGYTFFYFTSCSYVYVIYSACLCVYMYIWSPWKCWGKTIWYCERFTFSPFHQVEISWFYRYRAVSTILWMNGSWIFFSLMFWIAFFLPKAFDFFEFDQYFWYDELSMSFSSTAKLLYFTVEFLILEF